VCLSKVKSGSNIFAADQLNQMLLLWHRHHRNSSADTATPAPHNVCCNSCTV